MKNPLLKVSAKLQCKANKYFDKLLTPVVEELLQASYNSYCEITNNIVLTFDEWSLKVKEHLNQNVNNKNNVKEV